MAENDTTTQDAQDTTETAPVVPVTLEEALTSVDDGSRFADGIDKEELAEGILSAAKSLKSGIVSVTTRLKRMAETIASARRNVLRADGMPDWAGTTGTWMALAEVAYNVAFVDLPKVEQERAKNSVRQHLGRTYLEVAIREYVAESKDIEDNLVFPSEESRTTDAFLFAVRRQYVDAGLTVPNRYKTPEDKANEGTGGGGPGNGPKNPKDAAFVGIEGLSSVTPSIHSKAALRTVSDLVQRLTAKDAGAIEDRPTVIEDLERIGSMAYYAVKALKGKTTETDTNEVAGAFWTATDAQ